MSMHYAICHGPVDALTGIYVKERDAWPGKTVYDDDGDFIEGAFTVSFSDFISSMTGGSNVPTKTSAVAVAAGPLSVNRPDLFGGEKKEGGVQGTAHFLPGSPSQTMPSNLAAKLGLTTATCPGYRGICSVFFHGGSRGFLWSQNNPYLPAPWFTVYRKPLGLTATQSTIQVGDNPPDANPAHIIYECLTNTDWGMGAPSTMINVDSFEAAGVTLIEEEFGLSMIWNQQSTIESFVSEVLDHIQATLYVNPRTGLIEIKLIRGDYSLVGLRELNEDNCVATNRQRKAIGEIVNEIVVTWTNPVNEKEETLTFQDPAGIAIQGGVASDSRNYYGVRNSDLGSRLGVRDLRSASYPLFSCDAEVDRTAWDVLPGDVVKFSWAEDDIAQIICRVLEVDYGSPRDSKITLKLTEDVFSLEAATYIAPVVTGWVSPDEDPTPLDFVEIITAPLVALTLAGVDALAEEDQFPRVVPAILGAQTGSDTYEFVLNGPVTLANGDTVVQPIGSYLLTDYSETAVVLAQEASSTITGTNLGALVGSNGPVLGDYAMLGTGGDAEMEIVLFDAYNEGTDTWTLARGMMDTVPKAWASGTPVWYIPTTFAAVDTNERLGGSSVTYKLQTRTRKGLLPLDETPDETVTLTNRPYLPNRPANVSVGGTKFGTRTYTGARPSLIAVTWANRNRLLEDTVPPQWTEGNVTPEDGQTTTIRVYEHDTDNLIVEYTDLTGTSHNVPYADMEGHRNVDFGLIAERDGLESIQGIRIHVFFDFYGYGNNYGNDYSENDGDA
jgi:hypothetical protein